MYTHIVVLEPEELRAFNALRNKTAGVEDNNGIGYATTWIHRRSEAEPNYNTLTNVEVVFAQDEESANKLAKILAVSHPNRNVYVAKTTALLISKPTAPTATTISEKGMVPK